MKALIIVSRLFNGHELIGTLKQLSAAGFDWEIASRTLRIADELTGEAFEVNTTLEDLATIPDIGAICNVLYIISGNMKETEYHWRLPVVQRAVEEVYAAGGVVAAICCSAPCVRYIADGKKVTCFPLVRSKALLKDAGAIITGRSLEVDGRIVTAEHQMCTLAWTQAAIDIAQGKDPDIDLDPEVAAKYFKFWRE